MKKILVVSMFLLVLAGCKTKEKNSISIIPQPLLIEAGSGFFPLRGDCSINFDEKNNRLNEIADFAITLFEENCGLTLSKNARKQAIKFELTNQVESDEGYELEVTKRGVKIKAGNEKGIFFAVQSLRQLLVKEGDQTGILCCKITDEPRFVWRGVHLDVSRHFYTVGEVKQFIDLMSAYKMNCFHWHLTDDQGWRIEIKKYPRLTEIGAWRKKIGFKENQLKGLNLDNGEVYGGFYTQDEIRDVVDYARCRNIEIVPEIEIPGHAAAALVAYPEYYCFPNEPLEVWTEGGVSNGVYCAGKEETFVFLENILTEVMDLFPSKYIHVGGDEAPKANWNRCPLCRKRIKDLALPNAVALQNYTMNRIEKFVHSKGREIIGWDEIAEGELSKTAAVMAWRSTAPGIEAAESGNKVVMTPGVPCYFDYPQSINNVTKADSARSVNSLRDVYDFNPVPKGLASEFKSNILGVQCANWTEYTPNLHILIYRSYPRILALAEVAWSADERKNWKNFSKRLQKELIYLNHTKGLETGEPSYDVTIEIVPCEEKNSVSFRLTTEVEGDIFYTTDGTEPTKESLLYTGDVPIEKSCTVKARMYKPDGSAYRIKSQEIYLHKAFAKKAYYATNYSSRHNGGGDLALTNGQLQRWQGFEKSDLDVTIDLGSVTSFDTIETKWWYDISDWVFKPEFVTYELSDDNVTYEKVFEFTGKTLKNTYEKGILPLQKVFVGGTQTRYIRLRAKSIKTNPDWHGSAGAASWIFVDEIVVK